MQWWEQTREPFANAKRREVGRGVLHGENTILILLFLVAATSCENQWSKDIPFLQEGIWNPINFISWHQVTPVICKFKEVQKVSWEHILGHVFNRSYNMWLMRYYLNGVSESDFSWLDMTWPLLGFGVARNCCCWTHSHQSMKVCQ